MGRGGLFDAVEFTIFPEGLRIGRSLSNQLVIPETEISREHASITWENGRAVLKDLDSANGTEVNGQRITSCELKSGDRITFGYSGEQCFEFVDPAVQAEPSGWPVAPQSPSGKPVAIPTAEEAEEWERKSPDVTMVLPPAVVEAATAQTPLHLVRERHTAWPVVVPPEGLVIGSDSKRSPLAGEFSHTSISAAHAEFYWLGSLLCVRDLGSLSGTYVNGRRIAKHELAEADFIRFGDYHDCTFLFRSGKNRGLSVRDIPLQGDLLRIGRGPENEICLDHPAISRRHAEIRQEGSQHVLYDLASTNGSFVNGAQIRRRVLQRGDIITIGPMHLRFDGRTLEQRADGTGVRLDLYRLAKHVGKDGFGQLVLDDISLEFQPRHFVGLLGPSGCGKTSLLDAVSGFRPASTGTVLVNGMDMKQYAKSFRSTIGYVPQEDIVHRQLTVEECLRYAAGLRLPGDTTPEELEARVEEVLQQIGLAQLCSTPITLLSGGQRKRVSIGIEILSKPSILFLDEPTAGLDPHTEVQIMQLFRELANRGATLLTTTHVLGSFNLFDHVVILIAGKLAFAGPPDQMLTYFGVRSPHDIYEKLVEEKKPEEWKGRFEGSESHRQTVRRLQELGKPVTPAEPVSPAPTLPKPQPREGWRQWGLLSSRYLRLKTKDQLQVTFLLLQAPLIGVLVSFLSRTPNTPGTLFMVMFAALWFGCSNAVREISDEQSIYRRERQTGLLIPAYLFSKLAVLGAFGALQSVLLVSVLALMPVFPQFGGLQGNYFWALGVTFLINLNGTLIGLFLSSVFSSSEKALSWFPLVLIPELLLAGLFVPVKSIQRLIPLTNEQLAQQVVAHTQAELPPRLAEWIAESGLGRRVRGVVALDDSAAARLGEFLGGTTEGMGTTLRWLSAVCISRWGLEALADLYVHGDHARHEYAFQLINSVALTLHSEDAQFLRAQIVGTAPAVAPAARRFAETHADYLAILFGFAVAMTVLIGLLLLRRDKPAP